MIIIYLSPVPWDSIAQRPHFFVKHLLETEKAEKVFWINPTPSRLPKISDFQNRLFKKLEPKSISKFPGLEIINPGLFFPVEPIPLIYYMLNMFNLIKLRKVIENIAEVHEDIIFIQGKPSKLAQYLCNSFKFKKRIVDMMDDFPYFFSGLSRYSMKRLMKMTLNQSCLAIFSSSHLYDKYKDKCKKSIVIKNACSSNLVTELSLISRTSNQEKRVYGYIGSINSWFDWDSVISLAEKEKDSIIRLIGPCYIRPKYSLPQNIIIEEAVEHTKVPHLLKEFDYGLIPFKINELTESVDPVKYYEYIAAGLPVISSCFGEMKERIHLGYTYDFESYSKKVILRKDNVVTWEDRFRLFDLQDL